MNRPLPVPEHAVDPDSRAVRFGVFDGEFPQVNLDQARVRYHGIPVPGLGRLRLKQWQHYALITPELFIGFAAVDAGLLKTSWCHVVRRGGNSAFEHRRIGPLLKLQVSRGLWRDDTEVRVRGYQVLVQNRLQEGEHRLSLDIAADGERPAVSATLRCQHDLERIRPMVVVLPVGGNRGMYSHKVPLPLSGQVTVGDETYQANPSDCFAILDVHKAHYPRHTWWNWATFAGLDRRGRVVGMNLTRNVNRDDATLNENGLWLDGELRHLGRARFEFDGKDVMRPWQLGTDDGAVDLTFSPSGERSEDLDLGLMRSKFHQIHGSFSGEVCFDGETVEVDQLFGVCEDHDSIW